MFNPVRNRLNYSKIIIYWQGFCMAALSSEFFHQTPGTYAAKLAAIISNGRVVKLTE